ncbi:hypothetical protein BamMEX5DRAFT_6296 [Burkholderia ambifaria MEX-5]|uniref:Uncharacterized protein n=1 Tax=Burkholderia ambifaria MEX-5 TaxID=396597 RepID=B1TET0_9BURK|nr:hypothetical protein BamMEX5DRAFT_6296 [Burkholderia ambifaria MEX-5]
MDRIEAARDQVRERRLDRIGVVEPDQVGLEALDRPVDEHGRDAGAAQRAQHVFLGAQRVDDQPFDPVGREQLQEAPFHLDFVRRVTDERHVAERVARGLDALQHFDGVRVGQIGREHAEQPVAAALQPARHLVRPVVQARDRRLDPLAQIGGQHVRLAVQIARNAGLARAGFACDVADRRGTLRGRLRIAQVVPRDVRSAPLRVRTDLCCWKRKPPGGRRRSAAARSPEAGALAPAPVT